MTNNIKCYSAPIETEVERHIINIKKHCLMNVKHPKEIIEYNKNSSCLFISPFLVNELLDFKTRNAMLNEQLKNNPTMEDVINEYKISYRRLLRCQFNKLTYDNVDDTVEFIINSRNNILDNKEMIEFIVQRVKNDIWVMKLPIITAYGLLIKTLTEQYHYDFNFKFDKNFLDEYLENDEIYSSYENVVNNIVNLIIVLYNNNILNDNDVNIFFDDFIMKPKIPEGVEFNTFCKVIISSIHGLPKGDPNFKPGIMFELFSKYIKTHKNVIDVYKTFLNEKGNTFLSRMLMEIIDNVSNDRICCEHCKMRIEKNK